MKKPDKVWVQGRLYDVAHRDESCCYVTTPEGVRRIMPQWIGWTFTGYRFSGQPEETPK